MSSIETGPEQPGDLLLRSIRRHWVLFLVEGLMLIAFGAIAIIVPGAAALAVTVLLGWLFLLSGILGLVTTIWMWPFGGVLSLTLGLAIFFLIEGAVSIMYALDHRREFSGRWGWMLASGVVDIVLALLILAGFPGTAAWAIGLLVGINMLMGGVALVAMALHARAA
jgi:uncharacterized membrane protein HdeD (DUF308 family)